MHPLNYSKVGSVPIPFSITSAHGGNGYYTNQVSMEGSDYPGPWVRVAERYSIKALESAGSLCIHRCFMLHYLTNSRSARR